MKTYTGIRDPKTRARRLWGRFVLRTLLGAYYGIPANSVTIEVGPTGKPYVAATRGSSIYFNVSGGADVVMLAFSLTGEIGVDVELLSGDDFTETARSHLTAKEFESWRLLPTEEQSKAFIQAWTIKEAVLKLRGVGLHAPLASAPVRFFSGKPVKFLPGDAIGSSETTVSVRILNLPENHQVALAFTGQRNMKLQQLRFEPDDCFPDIY